MCGDCGRAKRQLVGWGDKLYLCNRCWDIRDAAELKRVRLQWDAEWAQLKRLRAEFDAEYARLRKGGF